MSSWPKSWVCSKRFLRSGVTLIELLVVISIVGILASISVPSYQRYVQKGYREAAKAGLVELATQINQLRARSPNGELLDALDPVDLLSRSVQYYDLTIIPNPVLTTSQFLVVAEPKLGERQQKDGALSLTSLGQGCWYKEQDVLSAPDPDQRCTNNTSVIAW